jgi:hypothetical protein
MKYGNDLDLLSAYIRFESRTEVILTKVCRGIP